MEKGMGKQQRERMLLQAAFSGNLCLFRKMTQGLDTTGQGDAPVLADVVSGSRALHLAATEGRMDVLRYLVEDLRLDVNQTNDRGLCEVVELLLSRGIGIVFDSLHGTPLRMAATHGQGGTMKILLDHHADAGADVNFRDSNGATYVMAAANYGFQASWNAY